MSEDPLRIELLDGEYTSHAVQLARLCLIEGNVLNEREPSSVLEETRWVLELQAKRYRAIRPTGSCFTVLVSRSVASELTPLVRLDVFARQGLASAGVVSQSPRWDTAPVMYSPEDGALEIACKILGVAVPL
ncbi:hypothetical protein [Paraburkholderia hiiakae]|nr:hypothetical protein [Paraburkholderia hiiakae]